MRYNGVDVCTCYKGISVNKEIPPGMPARDVETAGGWDGEILTGVELKQGRYLLRVNIGAKSKEEAWRARAALAAWATSGGGVLCPIEPTHWPGRAYDGIVGSITDPEFIFGFATVDVTFVVPRPVAYEIAPCTASGAGQLDMVVRGSMPCGPTITQTIGEARTGLYWTMGGAKLLTITGALAKGDVVAVNLREGLLTVNGQHAEERINVMETGWAASFAPGLHTITSQDKGQMEARWHTEWA